MVHAFVMVETGPGESEAVRTAASELENVGDAHVVAGNFDVIVEVNGRAVEDVLAVASTDLQAVTGVERTKTYISLSS